MKIDKEELNRAYANGEFDKVFKTASEIITYLLARKYYTIYANEDDRFDMIQDCLIALWQKHEEHKIDLSKGDLMAFIWKNSNYRILDYLKKKDRRNKKVYFVSYDEIVTDNYCSKLDTDAMLPESFEFLSYEEKVFA